jgi:hypothetical protein
MLLFHLPCLHEFDTYFLLFTQKIHVCDTGCASLALDAHSRILCASPSGNLTILAPCWSKDEGPRRMSGDGDVEKEEEDDQCARQGESPHTVTVTALEPEYT